MPTTRDAHGFSGVLVGLELHLHHGLQSNSVPTRLANPMGVRGRGCALAALGFSLPSDFFATVVQQIFPLPCTSAGHEQVKFPVAQNRISWCRKAEFAEAPSGEDGFSDTLPPPLPHQLLQAGLLHQGEGARRRGDTPRSPLTEGVPSDDAVLHLPAGSRVVVVGQEGPDAWAGLSFRDVKGTLVGPREGGTVVVDVVEVHQHLWSGGEGGRK